MQTFVIGLAFSVYLTASDSEMEYVVVCAAILVIGNVVLFLNLFPRIFAALTGNEEQYEQTPDQRIESKIKQELARFSNGRNANLLSFSSTQMVSRDLIDVKATM